MADFELSKYQKNILDYFKKHPHDNMVIEALAGSGKSSTNVLLTETTKTSDVYLAFNTTVAKEFREKVKNPKTKVYTIHSLAFSIMCQNIKNDYEKGELSFKEPKVNNWKIYNAIDKEIAKNYKPKTFEDKVYLRNNLFTTYNLIRLTMGDIEDRDDIADLVSSHDLFNEFDPDNNKRRFVPEIKEIQSSLLNIYEYDWSEFEQKGEVDFTDMLYITYWQLKNGEWEVPYWNLYTNIYLDECIPAYSFVKCENRNFTVKKLFDMQQDLKSLPKIKSFNHTTQTFEYKKIEKVKFNGEKEVFEIKTEGLNKLKATANHPVLTQRGYIPVKELIAGKDCLILDNINNQKTKFVLNDDQLQLVLASMLGDGHLEKLSNFNTYRIDFTQGDLQYKYFKFKKWMMNCSFEHKGKSGYTQKKTINFTSSKVFILFDDPWNLMTEIDERFLSIWFQDDGTTFYYDYAKEGHQPSNIRIACNNLTQEQCLLLKRILKEKFNLNFRVYLNKKYWEMDLNKDDSVIFLKLIAPYMNESCAYKNPWFDKNKTYKWDNNFKNYGANYITSIRSLGISPVYDIEVQDNHNFVYSNSHNPNITGAVVHNCQDLSKLQLSFVPFIKRSGGRVVATGDFFQSCYFFAGGDSEAFNSIPVRFYPCKKFPLPVTYRCPQSHVELINNKFGIPLEARPKAPQGKIIEIEKENILKYIKPGDMVISRKNRWLGSVIIKLISNGYKIFTEDKEMVEGLKKLIDVKKFPIVVSLKNNLDKVVLECQNRILEITQAEVENNKNKKNKEDIEKEAVAFSDHLTSISALNKKLDNVFLLNKIVEYYCSIYSSHSSSSKIIDYIDEILSLNPTPDSIRITSVHKAKGLEANNVFVLNRGEICQAKGFEQSQQERNLSYISLTRAKNIMYLVFEPEVEEAKKKAAMQKQAREEYEDYDE